MQYPNQRFFKILTSVETAFRKVCDPKEGCGAN